MRVNTRCYTGKVFTYKCDLSHEQHNIIPAIQRKKFFSSNLSLVILKKRFAAMAFIQTTLFVCLQL